MCINSQSWRGISASTCFPRAALVAAWSFPNLPMISRKAVINLRLRFVSILTILQLTQVYATNQQTAQCLARPRCRCASKPVCRRREIPLKKSLQGIFRLFQAQ